MRIRIGALCALFVAFAIFGDLCSLPALASGETFSFALGGGNTTQTFAIAGDSQCTATIDLVAKLGGAYVTPFISTNSGVSYTSTIAPLIVPASQLATTYLDNPGQSMTFNATSATNVQMNAAGGAGGTSYITGTLSCNTTNAPTYIGQTTTATNTAPGLTFHYVAGFCAAATTCTVNFTTSWASVTSYECAVTSEGAADAPYLSTKATGQIVITGSTSVARDWICAGT